MPEQFSIKVWRVNAGMTQQDVADKLGLNKATIVRLEKEGAELRGLELYALAKLYKTEVDYIKAKNF